MPSSTVGLERAREHHATPGRTLVLFSRSPESEAATKGLNRRAGPILVEALLRGWQAVAAQTGAEFIVAAPEAALGRFARMFPGVRLIAQAGRDLGERLEHAFAACDTTGRATLLVGGDCASPAAESVETVFLHLEGGSGKVALLPAHDGGVNGIGLSAGTERAFQDIPWYTGRVAARLVAWAAAARLSVVMLDADDDVDTPGRLGRIARRRAEHWHAYAGLVLAALSGPAPCIASPRQSPRRFGNPVDSLRGPPPILSCRSSVN